LLRGVMRMLAPNSSIFLPMSLDMEVVRVIRVTMVAIPTIRPMVRKAILALRRRRLLMEILCSFMISSRFCSSLFTLHYSLPQKNLAPLLMSSIPMITLPLLVRDFRPDGLQPPPPSPIRAMANFLLQFLQITASPSCT